MAYTLHPTPFTLHPTPWTLQCTTNTFHLHPTQLSRAHPTPYTQKHLDGGRTGGEARGPREIKPPHLHACKRARKQVLTLVLSGTWINHGPGNDRARIRAVRTGAQTNKLHLKAATTHLSASRTRSRLPYHLHACKRANTRVVMKRSRATKIPSNPTECIADASAKQRGPELADETLERPCLVSLFRMLSCHC